MYIFTVVIHVLVCLFLIGVVLLQAGKGAEMGATFGGSSQSLFGARGAATFLSKMTIGAAVFYFVTSLSLTLLKRDRSIFPASVETLATSTSGAGTSTVSAATAPVSTPAQTSPEAAALPPSETGAESLTLPSPPDKTPPMPEAPRTPAP